MRQNPKIVIYGTGAIGGSTGAWIAKHYENIYFISRGENEKAYRENGITTYQSDQPDSKENVPVKVISSIREAQNADVVVIGVKNYSLDAAAKEIKESVGDTPIIVGFQNGLDNQKILPKYFSKVIYCVINYSAWIDEPGVIGYQRKGPLVLGTMNNKLSDELKSIAEIFNLGVNTQITEHFQDAAHTKLIMNLASSLTTLVGLNVVEIDESKLGHFQELFTRQMWEGVQIVKGAGFKEHKIQGTPPWWQIWLLAKLPQAISSKMFLPQIKKFAMSSMAQDIIQRKSHVSELENLNGYLVGLAKKAGVRAPINQAIYELCKESFSKPEFKPMDVEDVWKKAKSYK